MKVFMPAGAKQPVVVHYTEHCPPDVGAAFIWLKNRDPDRWRDVQNVEHVLGKYIISDKPMTIEQWAAERATVINDVIGIDIFPASCRHRRRMLPELMLSMFDSGSILGIIYASFIEVFACLPWS